MDLLTAIHTRQSVKKVLPDPVPQELVEKLLDAAIQAPNHYRNRPWRFVVIAGRARERLGDVMARSLARLIPGAPEAALEKERAKPLRAPLLIAVGIDPPVPPNEIEVENICAGAAAVENLLLAARGLGLGAMWRTGTAARDPEVKAFLGFSPEHQIIAILYIGYPDGEPVPPKRLSYADRTTWMAE